MAVLRYTVDPTATATDAWDAGWVEVPSDAPFALAVGSLSAAQHIQSLKDLDIVAVLTVASRLNVFPDGKPTGIDHLQLTLDDHPCADVLSILPAAFEFITESVKHTESKEGKVVVDRNRILVHCASGVSRSVSVCVALLISQYGLSVDDALAAVRVGRPRAMPNAGFRHQLESLEHCNGNVEQAKEHFQRRVAGDPSAGRQKLSIMETLIDQRGHANDIHAKVDTIENAMTTRNKTSSNGSDQEDGKLIQDWGTQLKACVQAVLDKDASLATSEHTLKDRPAQMIRKSALQKATRLLDDLSIMYTRSGG